MRLFRNEPPQVGTDEVAVRPRLTMSVLADELATPSVGFSAPSRTHPLLTHLHGVAAHLVFGATVAAVSEATWAITNRLRPASDTAVKAR